MEKDKVTFYLDKIHGFKPHRKKNFFKNSNKVTLYGVMGLPKTRMSFLKRKEVSEVVMKKFPKTKEEEEKLVKVEDFFKLN